MTKIFLHTIGCRSNQYDTAVLRNKLKSDGMHIVSQAESANIAVINTCTVTDKSDLDTRRIILRLIRQNPKIQIALIGCQTQIQQKALLKFPNVHWVLGNVNKFDLPRIIKSNPSSYFNIPDFEDNTSFDVPAYGIDEKHTRANLKIQEGCDNVCSFCDVTFARGPARSREFDDILKEAKALSDFGHKEIILTGINLGAYRCQNKSLLDVIKALEDIVKLKRIRISSIEPTAILSDVISYMSNKTKLCRFLHIPLQHGHDHVLTQMRRNYTISQLRQIIDEAFYNVKDVCIGSDIIVGFPGETDDHFQETYNLMKILSVNYFHVFSFSKRIKADAKNYADQIPDTIKQQRSASLRALSQRKRHQFYERMIGKTVSVLFENKRKGAWVGLTDNFIRVQVPSEKNLENKISRVTLSTINGQLMTGHL